MRHAATVAVLALGLLAAPARGAGAPATGETGSTTAPATIADVAWLAGVWVTRADGELTEERWTPPAGGGMLGVARTVAGERMRGFEFLRIIERDGGLVYVAQPGGNPPTEFVATAVASSAVTFENPAHDAPKVIRYALLADGTLEARVGDGADDDLRFVFSRER